LGLKQFGLSKPELAMVEIGGRIEVVSSGVFSRGVRLVFWAASGTQQVL